VVAQGPDSRGSLSSDLTALSSPAAAVAAAVVEAAVARQRGRQGRQPAAPELGTCLGLRPQNNNTTALEATQPPLQSTRPTAEAIVQIRAPSSTNLN